jgi:predicted RNase H-like HicB family nuclease
VVIVASEGTAMRLDKFEIMIQKEPEDAGYSACSPSLPGCFSNGRTIEKARHMLDAIRQHVAALLAQREPVPQVLRASSATRAPADARHPTGSGPVGQVRFGLGLPALRAHLCPPAPT